MKIKFISKKEGQRMASELGRRGGLAIVKKRGKDYMRRLGQKGGRARWSK